MVRLIALYNRPDDADAFDTHYRDTHLTIISRYPKLRDVRMTRTSGVGGRETPYYLMTEMMFDTAEDLGEALASEAGVESAKDLRNFAGAGVTLFVASEA